MSDHLSGWCVRYGDGPPHYADLLIKSNAPHPMCQPCTDAWRRAEPEDRP